MELYILSGMAVIYFITYLSLQKNIHKKIWTFAFVASFLLMGLSTVLLRVSHHKGMSILGLDEFYILYIISTITFLLGLFVIWLYKIPLYKLFKNKEDI